MASDSSGKGYVRVPFGQKPGAKGVEAPERRAPHRPPNMSAGITRDYGRPGASEVNLAHRLGDPLGSTGARAGAQEARSGKSKAVQTRESAPYSVSDYAKKVSSTGGERSSAGDGGPRALGPGTPGGGLVRAPMPGAGAPRALAAGPLPSRLTATERPVQTARPMGTTPGFGTPALSNPDQSGGRALNRGAHVMGQGSAGKGPRAHDGPPIRGMLGSTSTPSRFFAQGNATFDKSKAIETVAREATPAAKKAAPSRKPRGPKKGTTVKFS